MSEPAIPTFGKPEPSAARKVNARDEKAEEPKKPKKEKFVLNPFACKDPKRVYKYGARPPVIGGKVVRDLFYNAHLYRNRLCELDIARRGEVDAKLLEMSPRLHALNAEIGQAPIKAKNGERAVEPTGLEADIEEVLAACRARRIRSRSKAPDAIAQALLKPLKARMKVLRAEQKVLKDVLFARTDWKESQALIESKSKALHKEARRDSCLTTCSGTYKLVEQAARSMRSCAPASFRRWADRKDHVSVQVTGGGMTVADLLGCEGTFLRLEVMDRPGAIPGSGRGEKRKIGVLHIRVGSLDKDGELKKGAREPLWARVPLTIHRDLPADAKVKIVTLSRVSVGTNDVWSVEITLQKKSWEKPGLATSGSVGIDVGWRLFPDRLRIAVWAGSDGEEGEIALPRWWVEECLKQRRIQGYRDVGLDGIRERLSSWALSSWEGHLRGDTTLEEERRRKSTWILRSKSCKAVLEMATRAVRFGVSMPTDVEAWRKREAHLFNYEDNLRKQTMGSRKDLYRCLASFLSKRYAVAYIEDLDFRTFHVTPSPELGETITEKVVKKYINFACVSSFNESIKHAFRVTTKVNHRHTTEKCNGCGHINDCWERPEELIHACESCGIEWDRDVNAARNILGASGYSGTWGRAPLAPDRLMTYEPGTGNMAQRRAKKKRDEDGLDTERYA